MNERAQLLKQESGSGPGFRFEGKKVRKVGAEQVRMNSWLFPAAGAPSPEEGATSGSGACHGQRPLGAPLNPKLPPLPVFVLKSCINEFFLDFTSLTARCSLKCSFTQRYSVWLRMIIENINIRSLAVSMWSWVFLVTYQQTSGRCQPLMCVTPAASGRMLVVNGSDGTLKSCEAKLLLGKRVGIL